MEVLLQYLDDLDDLFGTIGLLADRYRDVLVALFSYLAGVFVQLAGMLLALRHPPLALALAALLGLALLQHFVPFYPRNPQQTA